MEFPKPDRTLIKNLQLTSFLVVKDWMISPKFGKQVKHDPFHHISLPLYWESWPVQ